MMPFSVLRIWGTGILSWAVLAGAMYCLWEAARRTDPPRPVAEQRHIDSSPDPVALDPPVEHPRQVARASSPRNNAWPFLVAGLGLLAFSGVGFLPLVLLLGKPGLDKPQLGDGGKVYVIERPDGTRLHVEIHGNEREPTVIFTHGWSLDRTAWGYVERQLARQFRIVVWDLPGLGQSKGPSNGNYDLEKMADDLAAVIQEYGRGQVILVGHSIGGMIMQVFCRLYPKQLGPRVTGIVLVHTTYTNPLNTAVGASFWKAIEKLDHLKGTGLSPYKKE